MKVKLRSTSLLIGFLIANVILFAGIIFLLFKTQSIQTAGVSDVSADYSFSFLPPDVAGQINPSSRAFIIYDTNNRTIVGGKNEKLRFAPASSAKIMATLIALENYNLDQVLTSENLEVLGSDNSKMDLVNGEQMTVENLLYGMMLPSGNDAAYVVAQNFPGGVELFVDAMNKKAETLNLKNTHFVDYDGYDDANYTTAYDMARLAAHAMKNQEFARIVSTKYKYVTDVTGEMGHGLSNLNVLLGKGGVNGVKTGYTDEAGGVLVTSINEGDKNYIVVVLGSDDRFSDTKNVIDNAIGKMGTLLY